MQLHLQHHLRSQSLPQIAGTMIALVVGAGAVQAADVDALVAACLSELQQNPQATAFPVCQDSIDTLISLGLRESDGTYP
jgi:hypothetical protein